MPYLPSPISASPLSLRRMRLKRAGLDEAAVTGGGSYPATWGWSRRSLGLVGQRRPLGLERARAHVHVGERLGTRLAGRRPVGPAARGRARRALEPPHRPVSAA